MSASGASIRELLQIVDLGWLAVIEMTTIGEYRQINEKDVSLDLFLQIFDDGTLTDAQGKNCDFRESVFILTRNLN